MELKSSALHFAAYKENPYDALKALNDQSSEVFAEAINEKNQQGDTALHILLRRQMINAAEYLIANGAEITIENAVGDTPFHLIASLKSSTLLLKLIRNPNTKELCQKLAGTTNNKRQLPLHCAIQYSCNTHMVDALLGLDDYAGITTPDRDSCSPLLVAAKSSHMVSLVRILLDKLPKVQCFMSDKYGNYAIHLAASSGYPEVIAVIFERFPAQVKLVNTKKETPLHIMAILPEISDSFNPEIVQMSLHDFEGKFREVMFTIENYPALKFKINAKLFADEPSETQLRQLIHEDYLQTLLLILETAKQQDYLDELLVAQDELGDTALHAMIKAGRFFYVQVLLQYGAKVDMPRNIDGKTPLDLIVYNYTHDVNNKIVQQLYALMQQKTHSTMLITHPIGEVTRIPVADSIWVSAQEEKRKVDEKRKPIVVGLVNRDHNFDDAYKSLQITSHSPQCEVYYQRYKRVIPTIFLGAPKLQVWPSTETKNADKAWAKGVMQESRMRKIQARISRLKCRINIFRGTHEESVLDDNTLFGCPENMLLYFFENDKTAIRKFKELSPKERKDKYLQAFTAELRQNENLQNDLVGANKKDSLAYLDATASANRSRGKLNLLRGKYVCDFFNCPGHILLAKFEDENLIGDLKYMSPDDREVYVKSSLQELGILEVQLEELKSLEMFAEEVLNRIMDLEKIEILIGNLRGAVALCWDMPECANYFMQVGIAPPPGQGLTESVGSAPIIQ